MGFGSTVEPVQVKLSMRHLNTRRRSVQTPHKGCRRMPPFAAVSQITTSRRFNLSFRRHTTNHSICSLGAMAAAAVKEGLRVFFALFGTLALLAVVATARECMKE